MQNVSISRRAQGGFTLIELIVVIVILGILAATALPKFANLGADARVAKMQAARAAVLSGANLYHARWLAAGSPSTGTSTYDSPAVTVDNTTGYPTLAGMAVAAGDMSDYDTTNFASGGVLRSDVNHTGCTITYTASSTGPSVAIAASATTC